MADEPVGHESAVAAASYAHALLIDVATFEQFIDTHHNVNGVLLAPGTAHRQRELIAIATATTRIGKEHHIALRYQHLHLVEETIAILCLWPTMNFDY